MADYKKLYFSLFNQLTDIIEELESNLESLKRLQISTEDQYLDMAETEDEKPTERKTLL